MLKLSIELRLIIENVNQSTHISYINANTICTGGDIMQSFNEYKFANVTDEERRRLTDLEQSMSKDENSKIVLIAYENKSAES